VLMSGLLGWGPWPIHAISDSVWDVLNDPVDHRRETRLS